MKILNDKRREFSSLIGWDKIGDFSQVRAIATSDPYTSCISFFLQNFNMNIQMHVVKTVADHVDKFLDEAIHQLCQGCQIDHPSQRRHDCLMIEDKEERIYWALTTALKMLDWQKVKEDFFSRLTTSQILRCCPCFDDSTWWANLWKNEKWEDMLIDCLLA